MRLLRPGAAQEAMQGAVLHKASKVINLQEARQILGDTEKTTWEEILQKYDKLFENNAKAGSFYRTKANVQSHSCYRDSLQWSYLSYHLSSSQTDRAKVQARLCKCGEPLNELNFLQHVSSPQHSGVP
ncbi:unnamed protein product [Cochlearia groenlandica]